MRQILFILLVVLALSAAGIWSTQTGFFGLPLLLLAVMLLGLQAWVWSKQLVSDDA